MHSKSCLNSEDTLYGQIIFTLVFVFARSDLKRRFHKLLWANCVDKWVFFQDRIYCIQCTSFIPSFVQSWWQIYFDNVHHRLLPCYDKPVKLYVCFVFRHYLVYLIWNLKFETLSVNMWKVNLLVIFILRVCWLCNKHCTKKICFILWKWQSILILETKKYPSGMKIKFFFCAHLIW